ncbi:spermine synthase [Thermosulfuriphilus ammonigenes]|uniref:Polyamine aminopropyltransferase n=1 Tax=Thermosulfuriphilus ammonigenes TaxID=1936021 RepID=A0A6G7PYA7_9BACT|nr:spermine synthase [Thermosulfuriphilus ammonigenes]MBA2849777.1 spermidine synthase [Thermosulfuriphilus ammonigenes]QIJ72674.1 spermine synthase [Thermosulfuriphilus ammonigenes]
MPKGPVLQIGELMTEGTYHCYQGELVHTEGGLQQVFVLDNPFWGRMLIINGVVQLTTRDEFIYHEAMAHTTVQLFPEGRPLDVLICGGGDYGVSRELTRYADVRQVVIVDIDPIVPRVVERYIPQLLPEDRSRVELITADAFKVAEEFAREGRTFDIVIVDSTDPDITTEDVELSNPLFSVEFHRLLATVAPEGVVIQQAATPFSLGPVLTRTYRAFCQAYGPERIFVFRADVPAYGSETAFVMKSSTLTPQEPVRRSHPPTRYYSHEIHRASFVLPRYWEELLK